MKRPIIVILLTCIFFKAVGQFPQESTVNQGPEVVKDVQKYQQVASADPSARLVNVKKYVPGIVTSLRYSTRNNFTHEALYPPLTATYIRKAVADSLKKVQQELQSQGLGLKIFDAYRPYSVTVKMWELVKDDRYVADPSKGSGHNRGTAVDLTLINQQTGKELNMGTGFDNFTDTAHHSFSALPAAIIKNRELLRNTMERHGFIPLETEWWHYSITNASHFDLLDIDFAALKKMNEKHPH